jgi:hypothetical protein
MLSEGTYPCIHVDKLQQQLQQQAWNVEKKFYVYSPALHPEQLNPGFLIVVVTHLTLFVQHLEWLVLDGHKGLGLGQKYY